MRIEKMTSLAAAGVLWTVAYAGEDTPIHCEQWKTFPLDVECSEFFGWTDQSVEISGDFAIVGAPKHDHRGVENAGAAYIFRFNGTEWCQEAEFFDPEMVGRSREFGNSVAIDGNWAIVATIEALGGRVYAYERVDEVWQEPQELIRKKPFVGQWGTRVEMDGDVAIIGSTGQAYIFRLNQDGVWEEEERFEPVGGETSSCSATPSGSAVILPSSAPRWITQWPLGPHVSTDARI